VLYKMSRYTNAKVNISQVQIDKIKRAIQAGATVSIRLSHSDLNGEHVLALTSAQVNKITKAYQSGTGVTIKMSKTQLEHNAKVEGGFIGAILPFLATAGKFLLSSVLPTLATGVLSGVGQAAGSTVVNKIAGNGVSGGQIIYLKKNGMGCKVHVSGSGLYLSPWQKGSSLGEGLYMKSGTSYVDGSGLLLGPNSPFQNIPILGMLL
jgi:hypothetical protein